MRIPGFRLTIRRYMILVAAITLLIVSSVEAWRLMRLRADALGMAEYHAERVQEERQKLRNVALARKRGFGDDPVIPLIEDLARRRLGFHSNMRRKWHHLANRPWESVQPDPDEPTDARIVKKFEPAPLPYVQDDVPTISVTRSPAAHQR
jgi:hypothetical protein